METIQISSPKPSACQAEVEADERPESPNDCAICLEQLSDKSFTNSCFHMFCFHCLLAWSKVKPECPLCKQDFCSIIHNIRSMDDYDEYRVPRGGLRFPTPDSTSLFNHTLSHSSNDFLSRGHDFFSANRRFFSYRTTVLPGGFGLPRERSSSLVIQPYVDEVQIQNDCPRLNSSPNLPGRLQRRDVYLKQLEIRPPVSGSHRLCSPQFYRNNEGLMYRLVRWLKREIEAISQLGLRFNTEDVLSLIMEMLPTHDIQSTTFHRTLSPYLGIHTRRFIREFYNFAISPYDMEQYDRACVYIRERTGSQVAFIVTVGGDDSEDVQVIPSPSPMEHSMRPLIDLSELSSSRYAPSYLDNRIRSTNPLPSSSLHFVAPPNRSYTHQVINISDSENDDCVIIDEVRQTPETIVLDDSDTECAQPSTASNRSAEPIPSTSGYRPPAAATQQDDKSLLVLPSTSNSQRNFLHRDNDPLRNPNSTLRRSPSLSSVISTDNSIVASEPISESDSSRRRKKKSKRLLKKFRARKKSSSHIDYCDSSSDSGATDTSDTDWEENYKKKKKPKKCDKKSKKRRKSDHRCKTPKKRKPSSVDDALDYQTTYKPKRTVAKRRTKNSKEPVTENVIATGSQILKTSLPEKENKSVTSTVTNKPKLRSVVKIVEKSDPYKLNNEKKIKSCSEFEDDPIPGTSFGISANTERKLHSFIVRRSTFSSDSD